MLSSPRKPPEKRLLPSASLRFTHQVKLSSNFWNVQCLPDGGTIHTVNFEDVVAELQPAINFAKDFIEISRVPEAKNLWREAYPDLSEGKAGMLGAITGRAEAQAMRLSAIYALLDKSALIRPEHPRGNGDVEVLRGIGLLDIRHDHRRPECGQDSGRSSTRTKWHD